MYNTWQPQALNTAALTLTPLSLMQTKAESHDEDNSGGLIKARHGHTNSQAADDCIETPEEIAAKFNGTCKRLSAFEAGLVYFKSGGMLLGLFCIFIFAFTQTTRIMGDWWIRYAATAERIYCMMATREYFIQPLQLRPAHLDANAAAAYACSSAHTCRHVVRTWHASAHLVQVLACSSQLPDCCCRSWAADDPAHFYAKYTVMRSHQLYLLIYMALVLLFIGLLLTRDTLFSIWSIRASTKLHNTLFSRVLSAPVLFFLRTPIGDVLNAFARDQVRCLQQYVGF
jgi:ABC-type multidrug transport system fused ATPase/permease subunit